MWLFIGGAALLAWFIIVVPWLLDHDCDDWSD